MGAFCTLIHCLRVHGVHLCMWITLLLLILLLLYFHRVMNSSETLFIPKIQSANMISLLPFSPHTTSLISVRTQHIHMMFHLPFLFTLLFLETAEIYRLWMCIFSTLTSRFFFCFSQLVSIFPFHSSILSTVHSLGFENGWLQHVKIWSDTMCWKVAHL